MEIIYNNQAALKTLSKTSADITATLLSIENEINIFISDVNNNNFPAFTPSSNFEEYITPTTKWAQTFENVVFIGMGGSALGGQMLVNFASNIKQKPALYFVDNSDPITLEDLLLNLDLAKTCVITTSKSGGTIETLLATSLFITAYKKVNISPQNHIIGITETKSSKLHEMLTQNKVKILPHNPKVGGRFSVLTLVGLIPAAIAGMNISLLIKGANHTWNRFKQSPLTTSPAQGAALNYFCEQAGKNIHVMMPYSDKLHIFSHWHSQLWAESLGKNGGGTTPVAARGATDQHSILQLLADGKNDKLITIIQPDTRVINTQDLATNAINGLTAGELIYHQASGTVDSLIAHGQAVRVIKTPPLTAETLGELIMHFMLETVITAFIRGINPWTQDAVEDSKIRTKEYLLK